MKNVPLLGISSVSTVEIEPVVIKQNGSIYHFDSNEQPVLVGMNKQW